MKVHIGKYKGFVGPYQIAQMLCFWAKHDALEGYPDYVHNFGKWLAEDKKGNDSWLIKVCQWVDSKRKRKVSVKIDPWDSWNADRTLALIALPLLKQLQETKQGSAMVDDEDVPEEIRSTNAKPKENDWDNDEFVHARWDWVLSEILWALEQHTNDNSEDEFYDHSAVNPKDNLMAQVKSTKVNREGLEAFHKRKQRGFELLAKYWQGMWS